MASKLQVYKCKDSGLTVEVLSDANCSIECCGKPMELVAENTVDASKEKHVPVITAGANGGCKVTVGSVPHPMEPDHYIQWIEVINGSYVNRKYLKPGDAPEAEFYVPVSDKLIVREYCNKHGLWKA